MVSAIEEAGCFDSVVLDSVVGKRQHDNGDLQDEGAGRKDDFDLRQEQRPRGGGTVYLACPRNRIPQEPG